MTAKEYLKQAYLLDKQIQVEVKELEQLREMRGTIQGCSYGDLHGLRMRHARSLRLCGLPRTALLDSRTLSAEDELRQRMELLGATVGGRRTHHAGPDGQSG